MKRRITLLLAFFFTLLLYEMLPAEVPDPCFQQRVNKLLTAVADQYVPPSFSIDDPEKYYWPKAIARFSKYGTEDSSANAWINKLCNRSPFHFTLVGMTRLFFLFPEAPAINQNRITILKKVFERKDSYNAFTGEGTENHISMSRTSGYLFAQAALKYPEIFPSASEYLHAMKEWILYTARKYYYVGNGEWNSSIYETYNIIGWLNLYDFAEDPEIRMAARAVLDFYAANMALHYSWGTIGGPEMRGTGPDSANTNSMNYLCWLWFAQDDREPPFGFKGSQYVQSVHAATSVYHPPSALRPLARKTSLACSLYFRGSKPGYLLSPESFVKHFLYLNPTFSLGSAVSAYGGWTGSTAQIVPWKLVIRDDSSLIPYEIGGNGRFYDHFAGKMLQPFTQVAQYENVLIQATLTPVNAPEIADRIKDTIESWKKYWARDFQKRFPQDTFKIEHNPVNANQTVLCKNESYITIPGSVRITRKNSFFLADFGNTWIIIHPLTDSTKILSIRADGSIRTILINSARFGKMCGFILEVADTLQFENSEACVKAVSKQASFKKISANSFTYRTSKGIQLAFTYSSNGTFMEASSDWGFGMVMQTVIPDPDILRQPQWPSGKGFGRIPVLKVDGRKMDFSESWPVLEGPGVLIDQGIFSVTSPWGHYHVDFTGKVPSFDDKDL